MHRFFADNLSGSQVVLSAGEAHHAKDVLRLREGSQVELFDGSGRTAAGRITEWSRGEAVVRIERLSRPAARPAPIVHLAFAVPKGKRLNWLLEKATELAAASLRPVRFRRSVARAELSGLKRRRWLAHCIAAAKQCGLNFLPELREELKLNEFLQQAEGPSGGPRANKEQTIRLFGDNEGHAASVADVLARAEKFAVQHTECEIVLLVGPEGGLTQAEREACLAAGFQPVRLGQTTLRTETAAVALLAAVAALLS
ncbi:MAG: RsmE family RNA methyltransferase [Planctomycetota bacterium]|jgi:16S rRNA (uracil1498-N3)-methyltransferase